MSVSYGFLSTSPPTRCGLATFNRSLFQHLAVGGDTGGLVRVVDEPTDLRGADTVAHFVGGSRLSMLGAVSALNRFDVAIVQHDYSIYAGSDGEQVLDVLTRLRVPVIVVLHTVLGAPTPHQRSVLERIADVAAAVVVMSNTAATRLFDGYAVDASKVVVISHGAPPLYASAEPVPLAFAPRTRPTILSWGLIGPGKGLEWVIDALARLRDLDSAPHYLIAGQTHPKVLEREGEAYRISLMNRAEALGVSSMVRFDPGYRDTPSLLRLVRGVDVVVVPYDSSEQATSGVLIEAVAALRPVVATRFPHACELLANGSGLLVDHRDPAGLADALRRVLTEPGLAARMSAASARIAPDLTWHAVAGRYRQLAQGLIAARSAEQSRSILAGAGAIGGQIAGPVGGLVDVPVGLASGMAPAQVSVAVGVPA